MALLDCDSCGTRVHGITESDAGLAGLLLCAACNRGVAIAGGGYLTTPVEAKEIPMPAAHTRVTSVRKVMAATVAHGVAFAAFGDVLRHPIGASYVYIGMPGKAAASAYLTDDQIGPFGKPWACRDDPRGWQVAYREYLWARIRSDADFALAVRDLHGRVLVCWCKGKRPEHNGNDHCHGDTLAAAAEWLYHGIQDFGTAYEFDGVNACFGRSCGECGDCTDGPQPEACPYCGWDETSSDVHAEDCGR